MPVPEALGYPVAGRDRLSNRGIDIARPVRIAAGSGISARIRIAAGAVIIARSSISGRGCNHQSRDGRESQQRLPHGDTFPTLRRLQDDREAMQRQRRQVEMSRRVISARLLSGDLLRCRLRSKTVLTTPKRDFRSSPTNGRCKSGSVGPVRANRRHRKCDLI
jgi:hypothetical protein